MKPVRIVPSFASISAIMLLSACIDGPSGVEGSSDVVDLPLEGTIFTIVLENHDADVVEEMPYLQGLVDDYASADAYYADHHPSLPNYLQLLSGTDQRVSDDEGPDKHQLDAENLASQLDAAGIPWRAYMEDMGEPCLTKDKGVYAVRHNPFVYFTSVTRDRDACAEHVVDMDEHLAADLESDAYRYMWITPNDCNNMHDCEPTTADDWLAKVIPQIMESGWLQERRRDLHSLGRGRQRCQLPIRRQAEHPGGRGFGAGRCAWLRLRRALQPRFVPRHHRGCLRPSAIAEHRRLDAHGGHVRRHIRRVSRAGRAQIPRCGTMSGRNSEPWSSFVANSIAARERPDVTACLALERQGGPPCEERGQSDDFYSGHTAMVAASAGAVCANHSFMPLWGHPAADAFACGLASSAAVATAATRLVGDRHYFSDVFVGSVVGFGIGFAVPTLLHYRAPGGTTSITAMPGGLGTGAGLMLIGEF